MVHTALMLQGNTFKVKFECQFSQGADFDKRSLEFVVGGNIAFQVRIINSKHHVDNHYCITIIFVRFRNQRSDESYNIKLSCNEFNIKDKCFTSDDGTWHLIHEKRNYVALFEFIVSVVIDVVPLAVSFASLHEDEEFTDFELRGEDGSVKVHKLVLVTASPVLGRMLSGTWRETTEGYVQVKRTSKATLQNLKNYIYLSTLPEEGLEELMQLSSYYMMSDLKTKCVDKLVTMRNTCELMAALGVSETVKV